MYALRVTYLQRDQQRNSFDGVVPSVNKVSHKEIISKGDITSDCEELDQVMQLSMDISTDSNRCSDSGGVCFLQKDCCCFFSDELYLLLGYGFEIFKVVDDDI